MKSSQKKDQKETLKAWERVFVLAVALAVGAIGFWIYDANTSKPKDAGTVTESTECYTIAIPKEYKTELAPEKCQMAAYTGKSSKEPDNTILIVPYQDKIDTRQQAAAKLHEESPQLKSYKLAKVGGKSAIVIEGVSASGTVNEKSNRFYLAYGLKDYKPSAGEGASTNAFRVGFTLKSNTTDIEDQIKPILDSIVWK